MPIKKENKNRYPKDWDVISRYVREFRAGNKCEVCGIENYRVIKRCSGGRYRDLTSQEWELVHFWVAKLEVKLEKVLKHFGFTRIVLTVGHLDHTPENNDYSNLRAMCQYCHNCYDMPMRVLNRDSAQRDRGHKGHGEQLIMNS